MSFNCLLKDNKTIYDKVVVQGKSFCVNKLIQNRKTEILQLGR